MWVVAASYHQSGCMQIVVMDMVEVLLVEDGLGCTCWECCTFEPVAGEVVVGIAHPLACQNMAPVLQSELEQLEQPVRVACSMPQLVVAAGFLVLETY